MEWGSGEDLRRSEERLRDAEGRLRLIEESVKDHAILYTDTQGVVTFWSKGAERVFGYAEHEILGRPAALLLTPEDREAGAPQRELGQAAETGHGEDVSWHLRKDGTLVFLSGVVTPIRDGEGGLRGFAKVARDVTERKCLEDRLREGEERHRAILESISDAFFALDRDWRFTYVNRQAEALLGRSRADLLGKVIWEEYAPTVGTVVERSFRRAVAEDITVTCQSFCPPHDRWYEVNVYPSPNGLSIYFRDVSDRVRTEEVKAHSMAAIEQQRRIFDTALSNTPDFNYVFDLEGRLTYVNDALLSLWRKGLDEAVGRTFTQLVGPPELAERLDRQVQEVIATRQTLRDETPYTSHLGERQYEYIFVPVLGAGGEVEAVAGSTRDVTDRKEAEDRLRESEARFRQVADVLPQIVWVTRPDGFHEYYNRRWYEYIGCTPKECLGHGWNLPLHPDDRQRSIDRWDLALRTGEPYEIEYRFRSKGGEYRWFLGRALPVRDDAGRIVKWFGTCTDIEDFKRAEALLRESEARYRTSEQELRSSRERLVAALSASDTGTFRWDPETGDFLEFDDNLKGLFGLAPGHPVRASEDFLARVHPDDRPALSDAVDRCRRGDDFEMEYRVVLPDGGVRWLYDRGKMVRDGQGRPDYLVGACTDITKRKRFEEALQDADRRKDEFLATLGHELRNPLAPIRNALLLMRRHDDGDLEAERAMAERQVAHLARLVDDLMDVARIGRGQIDLHKEVVDLATIVGQAVETARSQIDDRRHRLAVSLPEGAIRLKADPMRLEQVLWNLLNNAAKYTDPGGRIALSAEPDGGEVVVRVRDTGIGIAPEMLPRVFDMFVQVGDHKGHAQGGLGIGLSLVRTLVEMHGGTITADSDGPGHGSEFVLRLPVLPPSVAIEAPNEDRRRPVGDKTPCRRILVVDDNVDAARSLAKLMSRAYGQEVRVAHDGPEALTIAEEFLPEVILLDIGLPGMDGNEVARRLRERPEFRRALFVALTGWGQESDVERSREAGFDHYLVKPANPEAILELLTGHGEVTG